jgi:uncharacterized coiled-coil protein SlyX
MPKRIKPSIQAVREVNPIASRVDPRAEPGDAPPPLRSGTRSALPEPRASLRPTPVPAAYPEFAELRRELDGDLVDDRAARIAQLEEILARKERQITELADALRRANFEKGELAETIERLRRLVDKLSKLGP